MVNSRISDVLKMMFYRNINSGTLTVFNGVEYGGMPMQIKRVFTIHNVPEGQIRGDHAHRYCTQGVVCVNGKVKIELYDGFGSTDDTLDNSSHGLIIPPGIWNKITFFDSNTVLLVFCDYPYDESDYIRDWDEFLILKKGGNIATR